MQTGEECMRLFIFKSWAPIYRTPDNFAAAGHTNSNVCRHHEYSVCMCIQSSTTAADFPYVFIYAVVCALDEREE